MKLIKSGGRDWQIGQDYFKRELLKLDTGDHSNFFIQEVRLKKQTQAKLHYHQEQTEIFYAIKNQGYFIIGQDRIDLKPGDILVIDPGEKHTVGNDTDDEFVFLAMKLNYNKKDTYSD